MILDDELTMRTEPENVPVPTIQSSGNRAIPPLEIPTELPAGTPSTEPLHAPGPAGVPTEFNCVPASSKNSTPMSALVPGTSRLVHEIEVTMPSLFVTPATVHKCLPDCPSV